MAYVSRTPPLRMWQFLYFLPLPQGQGSLRPTCSPRLRIGSVFFDSPPIMGVSDASILSSEVDAVLQVIQYRRYPQPMTIRAKQMIEKVGEIGRASCRVRV